MRFLRFLNLHESDNFVIKPITKADLPEIYDLCSKVRSVPENMGYDYVWGCQDKS